jgi:peptide chain release factor 2
VVKCSAERSQHKNRSTAMKMLKSQLYQLKLEEQAAEFAEAFESGKQKVDFGSQIRTYTMQPYTLVKDERTEVKTAKIDDVLDGDLDAFIEAYLLLTAGGAEGEGAEA